MATGGKAFESVTLASKKSKTDVIVKKDGTDPDSKALLRHIFLPPDEEPIDSSTFYGSENELDLCHLSSHIDAVISARKAAAEKSQASEDAEKDECGRIGPKNVTFDSGGNSGTVVIEADRLGVTSHSNFSTIRANVAFYKGKWLYELMLGSKGVMQVGWCTLHCKFSQEEGVGDTGNSYAYDGNRIRKWNVKTVKYGEPWLTGDVITCAIDCDEGTISFARNGKSFGVAFDTVRMGPTYAYFPAVSLSLSENLRANFGATPLHYPLEGYRPLQDPPTMDLVAAQQLFCYLERLLPSFAQVSEQEPPMLHADPLQATVSEHRSAAATLMLAANQIIERLAPLLKNAYIVEIGLFKLLLQYSDSKDPLGDHVLVKKTLDLLWALLQEHEMKHCMEHLVVSMLTSYRFSPVNTDFSHQQVYLTLTLAVLRHEKTRKYLLKHILFDKVKFPIFMHIKPPDDAGLIDFVPTVWWGFAKQGRDDEPAQPECEAEQQNKREYLAACDRLKEKVCVLEKIQIEIIKVLLNNKDTKKGASTRFIFLHKFREFLRENLPYTSRSSVNQCPLPVSLCFLHRLIQAVRFYWDQYALENPDKSVPSAEAYVPCRKFFDDSISYFDIHRVGGLLSHLKKTYKDELRCILGAWQDSENGQNSRSGSPSERLNGVHMAGDRDSPPKMSPTMPECHSLPSSNSLIELLDGVILLYLVAHKQLGKMCTLRDNLNEFVGALNDTQRKTQNCPSQLSDVESELKNADVVFTEKVSELSRQMAWVISVIYTKEKQDDVVWLLRVILCTVEKASQQDKLFSFLPDFYIEAAISTCDALRAYFHPTQDRMAIIGFEELLVQFALFLSDHFADPRIVQADVKDSLIQALACFVCYRMSLRALESIPKPCRMRTVKSLLAPYENRSWAQTNWILVRLWKGCGFGFRYKHLPHLMPARNQQQEIGNASLQKPCPSLVYQEHVKEYLDQDAEAATKLLDSLLNQLNWAFSEFVGMLQELQQISRRPALAIVDNRQLKICATCFDISVGLLRVLEMIVNLSPEILTDWKRPPAELLLCRLFQLLMQILSRVTSKSNMFETVVSISIPGLETVDHFPILTAVAGILVQLLCNGPDSSKECAVKTLLMEPGLDIASLEFLLGGTTSPAAAAATDSQGNKRFSFRSYKELDAEEIRSLEGMIDMLREKLTTMQTSPEINEDILCEICYARPKNVKFTPCGHQSCKACIMQHLMSRKECFFCKSEVKGVVDSPAKIS